MRRVSRAAGALKTALGRRGSIRSKILAGFAVILVGMLSINLNDYVSINGSLYDDWYTNRE